MKIAEIYTDTNIGTDRSYEYLVPENVKIGDVVNLNFGYRRTKGIVTRIKDEADFKGKLKKINGVDKKSLSTDQLRLSFFIKDKYKLPLYRTTTFFSTAKKGSTEEVHYRLKEDKDLRGKNQILVRDALKEGEKTYDDLKAVVPSLNRSTVSRLIELGVIEEVRRTKHQKIPGVEPLTALENGSFVKVSGYDELSKLLFSQAAKTDGQILVVFPNKYKARSFSRFLKERGLYPTLYLSDLPGSKKDDLLTNVASGNYRIVVGTHSSVFLPFKDLSQIIVAETGDLNYYSNDVTKYNLLEVIETLSGLWDKKVVYTDYVDSVLSLYKKRQGLWSEVEVFDKPEKNIKYVNNERELLSDNFLSRKLDTYLKEASADKKVYIVLNRISLENVPYCSNCGHSLKCPECNAFLQLDTKKNIIYCNRCGYETEKFEECPECGSVRIGYNDVGRPRLKETLTQGFPEKIVKEASEKELDKADIIVGTVGQLRHLKLDTIKTILAVTIDSELNGQNFLNGERVLRSYSEVLNTYPQADLVVQSSGYNNSFFSELARFDDLFLNQDLEFRRSSNLPPFWDLYLFTLKSDKPLLSQSDAQVLIGRIKKRFEGAGDLKFTAPYQVKDRDGKIITKFTIKDPKGTDFSDFLSELINDGEIKALNSDLTLLVNPSAIL